MALSRAGVDAIHTPARMDSEGLLALPALNALAGLRVGLITAPGGRGMLAPALAERGARIFRADVYERVPIPLSASAVARVRSLRMPAGLALSSGEALARIAALLPMDALARLRQCTAVAASERLALMARESGFEDILIAAGPQPRQMVDALVRHMRDQPAMA